MKERDLLRLRGPHGSFFLREDSPKPMLLVAGGTGFAPIKAIVEHAIAQGNERPMHIYWGGRCCADLYLLRLAEQWPVQHAHIRFTPVLSESPADEHWAGRTGLVHLAAMADHPDLSGHQAYVCGSPAMVAATRRDFLGLSVAGRGVLCRLLRLRCRHPDRDGSQPTIEHKGCSA
jgi:CDP-4-dehydro-6-deoxyglucose reductase